MKPFLLVCILVSWAALCATAADPKPAPSSSPALEKTPLPTGALVGKMPAFSTWRILYSYTSGTSSAKPGSGDPASPPQKITDQMMLPPRAVVITRTMPIYHVAVVDTSNRTAELWFDGANSFMISPGHPAPSLPGRNASGGDEIPPYLNYEKIDFPEVEWVSPKTYLGTLKGESASYWVFRKGDNGPTVWIDTDTRRPAHWQSGSENRIFEYLDAPAEKLALPPAVMDASKIVRRIDEVTRHRPPRGS